MRVGGRLWLVTRAPRAAAAAPGLLALLALQPEPARLVEAAAARAGAHARALVLSPQARRYLALQYRSYPTEFMGCMIGELSGNAVLVRRIAPADVDPTQSTATHVVPKQTCEDAGWMGTVGMIHSHPTGERCWDYFPGTQVASSDAQSVARRAARVHRPGPDFVLAHREEGLQVEQAVAGVDQAVEPGLRDPGAREVLAPLVPGQLAQLRLELGGEGDDLGFLVMGLDGGAQLGEPGTAARRQIVLVDVRGVQ